MNEEERIVKVLQEALPTTGGADPPRDLWPRIAERSGARSAWSWLDLGIAAAVAALLLLKPSWLRLLAYHL